MNLKHPGFPSPRRRTRCRVQPASPTGLRERHGISADNAPVNLLAVTMDVVAAYADAMREMTGRYGKPLSAATRARRLASLSALYKHLSMVRARTCWPPCRSPTPSRPTSMPSCWHWTRRDGRRPAGSKKSAGDRIPVRLDRAGAPAADADHARRRRASAHRPGQAVIATS
ncbi:hypothetical protein [Streptosporangium sandarakinum]|uniref:hypothetical protein n=1 Tax=Streptosporangium sandarakinum TaxID=1260955 RepID=UPI0036CC29C8